jgi:hypothetical protein
MIRVVKLIISFQIVFGLAQISKEINKKQNKQKTVGRKIATSTKFCFISVVKVQYIIELFNNNLG